MKLFDVLVAFAGLSLLLLAGITLRRKLRWLRQLGIPEALVAGLLGLLIGPFSFWPVFPEQVYTVWAQTPGVLISLVFATLFLGQRLPSPRQLWQRAAGQTAFGMTLGFGQYLVGALLVWLVLQPMFGTNPLMACLIEVGFEGGHGTAAGMGDTFADLGLASGEALGLAMATVGVVSAVLVGSALVVIGRSRAWLGARGRLPAGGSLLQRAAESDPMSAEAKLAREAAAGLADPGRDGSVTIDALTVNLALAGGAVGLGVLFKDGITRLGGALGGTATADLLNAIPVFPLAMLGGLVVQLVLQWRRHDELASPVVQASVGSLAMDVLITAAMASLNLPMLEENWLPFLLLALVGLAWNVAVFLLLGRRFFHDHWFERAIADFGQGTGVTATGLLLLRMADPLGRSRAMESFSFKQLVFEPFLGGGLITALAPIAVASWGLPRFNAVALLLTAASIAFGLWIGRRPQLQ
ncbi:sodium/glutamate symporter [Vulcanococcus sp. Clear-D1]|jgi:ESS family glutamate:Na+ symporter|uniref:sodium/glutamate symporter n=1 Tax=Vulcanococcus sp. Clear-D1 TaxID=2766970 RepID=UPI0019CCAF2A|nr:sodium/glutamate symporter [Vulcanococcus sp. Clear-D1]MBD1192842.1 sodium:solute symporter [Vulcanococcus sp. Clear-D1]